MIFVNPRLKLIFVLTEVQLTKSVVDWSIFVTLPIPGAPPGKAICIWPLPKSAIVKITGAGRSDARIIMAKVRMNAFITLVA